MYFFKQPFFKLFILPLFILSVIGLGFGLSAFLDTMDRWDFGAAVFALIVLFVSCAIFTTAGKYLVQRAISIVFTAIDRR